MSATLIKLQPRRSPEPGRPFVDRDRELGLIQAKLESGIQGKLIPSGVMCFWGAFGMGKSWLLIEVERRFRRVAPQPLGSHPTITARLDLNRAILPALWQDNQLNREQLIRELWKQLANQMGETPVLDKERASPDAWAEGFVNQVTQWSAQAATPVIMLDTVDDLVAQDERTFAWLEEHLVERLALTDRVLFIFASRGELRRWNRFQVRRRVDSHRLAAFDVEAVGQAVKANSDVSQALYRQGWGHPLVSEWLGTVLESQGIDLQTAQGVEQLLKPAVVQAVLRDVTGEMLRGLPELPANLARQACVLRWISVEPLRFLAEKMCLLEEARGDAYYLDLIARLQSHHLLYWNSVENSYEFDPVLRRLLAHFLELDTPAQFGAAHLAAFAFHRDHLGQYPQYLARYVPELAYHRTILAHCQLPEAPPPTLRDWWERFLLDERAPRHPEPWAELVQALERDVELHNLLPAEEYACLHSEAKQRAASA